MANRDRLTFDGGFQKLAIAEPFKAFLITLTSSESLHIDTLSNVIIGSNRISILRPNDQSAIIRKNQFVAIHTNVSIVSRI